MGKVYVFMYFLRHRPAVKYQLYSWKIENYINFVIFLLQSQKELEKLAKSFEIKILMIVENMLKKKKLWNY